jgi:hypothetical protein
MSFYNVSHQVVSELILKWKSECLSDLNEKEDEDLLLKFKYIDSKV